MSPQHGPGLTASPALDIAPAVRDADAAEVLIARVDRAMQTGFVSPVGRRRELRLSLGRIAPQRENIINARRLQPGQNRSEFLLRRTHAGQVSHGLNAIVTLDFRHKINRPVARAPARPVSDRHEAGREIMQPANGLAKAVQARVRLGREILK